NPILLDEVLQLKISDLKKLSLLDLSDKDGCSKIVNWRSRLTNQITSSITLFIVNDKFIFSYTYNGQNKKYYVDLHKERSNLGVGYVHYFICPITKLKCRKL